MDPTIEAVKEYLLRKLGITHPKGSMIHRWDHPHDEERSVEAPRILYGGLADYVTAISTPVLLIGLHPAIDKWIEPKLKKG